MLQDTIDHWIVSFTNINCVASPFYGFYYMYVYIIRTPIFTYPFEMDYCYVIGRLRNLKPDMRTYFRFNMHNNSSKSIQSWISNIINFIYEIFFQLLCFWKYSNVFISILVLVLIFKQFDSVFNRRFSLPKFLYLLKFLQFLGYAFNF